VKSRAVAGPVAGEPQPSGQNNMRWFVGLAFPAFVAVLSGWRQPVSTGSRQGRGQRTLRSGFCRPGGVAFDPVGQAGQDPRGRSVNRLAQVFHRLL
jgi:hypothetical protein